MSSLATSLAAKAPDRPVVFVHGINGSVLEDDAGNVVWGNLGSLKRSNFHSMNLLPESGAPRALEATDVLRDIPLIFGAIEVGIYSGIVDFLDGTVSFGQLATGNTFRGQYIEDIDLFVFAYDWRRSNFANALELNAFIEEHIPDGEYDIIAHSMGGIVSRIMLSQRGPNALCTTGSGADVGLGDSDYQDLCTAIYGASPSGSYPSTHLDAPRPAANRLHTFIEMAVPHYGSVNLAATLLEGWGRVSELLLGGKLAIQETVLSLAAPVELLPTYKNCCARGEDENDPDRFAIDDPYDEDYWLNLMLAFGAENCPYNRCDVRRELFRNGIKNRAIIDEIMDAGLPNTVKANHGLIGRFVKNTRQTVYVGFDAEGDGDAVTFKVNAEGDGTVHRVSARLPRNQHSDTFSNSYVVMHSKHPFIVGDQNATEYIYNMLVDPVFDDITAVSGTPREFAGGDIKEIGLDLSEQIILAGESTEARLRIDQVPGFDADIAQNAEVTVTIRAAGAPADTASDIGTLALEADDSQLLSGRLVYAGAPLSVAEAGIYTLAFEHREGSAINLLAQSHLYVLEEE